MNLPWIETLKQPIAEAIATARFGHAPLIYGRSGVGKGQLADWLAKYLLCLDPGIGPAPCGQCRSCALFQAGTHPDYFVLSPLEGHAEILVEQARMLTDQLTLTPSIGRRRVGLIAPAETLNRNAANALLKTIEEPAEEAWLVLMSHRPEALPATIRSRCQAIAVHPPHNREVESWLAAELPDSTADQRRLATDLAEGAALTARDWLTRDGLTFGTTIRDHLLQAWSDPGAVDEVPSAWLDAPESAWSWLARWSAHWCRLWMTGASADPNGPALVVPNAPPDLGNRLLDAYEQAVTGRSEVTGPLRQDLLFHQWLLQWADIGRGTRGAVRPKP